MSTIRSPLRVLVVDDEPLICWSLAETLRDRGDIVEQAATGREAIRALSLSPPPDVVLLDFELPDSHDLKLLQSVRRLSPGSRVILMSANDMADVESGALELGASRVVDKPFDVQAIPALVHEAATWR